VRFPEAVYVALQTRRAHHCATHLRAIRHYCYAVLPYLFRVGLMVGLLFTPFVIRYVNPHIRFSHACEIATLIAIIIFRNGMPEWLENQEAKPPQKFWLSFVRGVRLFLFVLSIPIIILLGPMVSRLVAALLR
jgi:hypothetical protein